MTLTFLFVHGIGVRRASLAGFMEAVRAGLKLVGQPSDQYVEVPCYWGEPHGTAPNETFLSVPDYEARGGGGTPPPDPVAEEAATWQFLYTDPMFEFRLLANLDPDRVSGDVEAGLALREAVAGLKPEDASIHGHLQAAGLLEEFEASVETISEAKPFVEATEAIVGSVTAYRQAAARAILAEAAVRAGATDSTVALPFLGDPVLRARLRDEIVNSLGGVEAGVGAWLLRQFMLPIHRAASRRIGAVLLNSHLQLGDVLRYQSRYGNGIRRVIREAIEAAEGHVVVLGHSLGGIASFELLVEEASRPQGTPSVILEKVALLATVGSQAPFLYEIDALTALHGNEPLPEGFPKWLNVFDRDDFLSFQAAGLFPERVTDREVRSGQPFPASHSAYWTNPAFWDVLRHSLAERGG